MERDNKYVIDSDILKQKIRHKKAIELATDF